MDKQYLVAALVVLLLLILYNRYKMNASSTTQGFIDVNKNVRLDEANKNNPAYTSGWGTGVRNRAWDYNTQYLENNLEGYDDYGGVAASQVVDRNVIQNHREYLDQNDGLVWGTSTRTSAVERTDTNDVAPRQGIWSILQPPAYNEIPMQGIMSQVASEYQDQMPGWSSPLKDRLPIT